MRFVPGLALIGLSLLLIWLFDIDVGEGKFGAGLASIPGIIGAYLLFHPPEPEEREEE